MKARIPALLLPFLATATLSAQGALWIVDETGAPGSDFTAIQPAVDAASDGDVILLRAATADPGFTILGKALTVVEDAGAAAATGPVTVTALAAGQSVTLRGFDAGPVALQGNNGTVLLEGMGTGFGIILYCSPSSVGFEDLTITSCSSVVLSDCAVGQVSSTTEAAIRVYSSTVHMYDVWAQGRIWGDGGGGLYVAPSSFVFASGGAFLGGCGSDSVSSPSAGEGMG